MQSVLARLSIRSRATLTCEVALLGVQPRAGLPSRSRENGLHLARPYKKGRLKAVFISPKDHLRKDLYII